MQLTLHEYVLNKYMSALSMILKMGIQETAIYSDRVRWENCVFPWRGYQDTASVRAKQK